MFMFSKYRKLYVEGVVSSKTTTSKWSCRSYKLLTLGVVPETSGKQLQYNMVDNYSNNQPCNTWMGKVHQNKNHCLLVGIHSDSYMMSVCSKSSYENSLSSCSNPFK